MNTRYIEKRCLIKRAFLHCFIYFLGFGLFQQAPAQGREEEQRWLQQLESQDTAAATQAATELGKNNLRAGLEKLLSLDNKSLLDSYLRAIKRDTGALDPFVSGRAEDAKLFIRALLTPELSEQAYSNAARRLIFLRAYQDKFPPTGLEESLFQRLPGLPPEALKSAGIFLSEQRYAPLLPYLLEMQKGDEPAIPIGDLCAMMASLGTVEAAKTTLACMQDARYKGFSLLNVLWSLISIPQEDALRIAAEVDFDLPALKAAVEASRDPSLKMNYFAFLGKYRIKEELPMLLDTLRQVPRSTVFSVLLNFDAPVHQQALEITEELFREGKINAVYYQSMLSQLDEKLPPEQAQAARLKRQARHEEFARRRDELAALQRQLGESQKTDPAAYAEAMRKTLEQGVLLAREYANISISVGWLETQKAEYFKLAGWVRFSLNQPRQSLELYEAVYEFSQKSSSAQLEEGNGLDLLALLLIGDIHQHALGEPEQAMASYERLLKELEKARGTARENIAFALLSWLQKWTQYNIRYLKSGETFSGELSEHDLSTFGALLYFSSAAMMYSGLAIHIDNELDTLLYSLLQQTATPAANPHLAEHLSQLPASIQVLNQTFPLLFLLEEADAILAYMNKHDPAGYWSASLFGLLTHSKNAEKSGEGKELLSPAKLFPLTTETMEQTAQAYFQTHNIHLAQPNQQWASPEQTWEFYLQSLRNGEKEAAVSCFMPDFRPRARAAFTRYRYEELRNFADSFLSFEVTRRGTDTAEAKTIYLGPDNTTQRTGVVRFVRHNGKWQIEKM